VTKHQNSSKRISNSLSRRDVLRAGGLLLPATLIAPAFFTRVAQAASSGAFNYYISTNGSDSNPGTLGSPWAITAINTKQGTYSGKRLGILPGTYDVSRLMGPFHSPALQINGGSSSTPTFIGSSNASGQYQAGTATLDAKGSSGSYGGGNSNLSTVIGAANGTSGGPGGPATPPNWGNWILDGIQITGFSLWAIQVGSYDSTGGQVPNATIQNCIIHDGNSANAPYSGVHVGPMQLYQYNNCMVSNCWFYNYSNVNANSTHCQCITVWGGISSGSSQSEGLTIELCTFVNAGGIYGIYDTGIISGTTIQQCYFDMTSAGNGSGVPNGVAIMGFGNTGAGGLAGSTFRNNIVRGGGAIDGYVATAEDQWAAKAACYNNTWDLAGGAGFAAAGVGIRFVEASGHSGMFSCYNNLCYDNGATGGMGYGYNACSSDGFAVCDYNLYGTRNAFSTYGASGGATVTSQTFSSWKSITGRDAHSSTNSANPFTNSGPLALLYHVLAGSPAYQTGRVGGVASGSACNIGAWDGTVTQIGYSSAGAPSGAIAQPNPPVLTVVS
jgi:hypothetical protein